MRKLTFTTVAASALATFAIGLAAPAFAGPSAGDDDNHIYHPTTVSSPYAGYPMGGQTPYGTYQNDDKNRPSR